MIKSVAIQQHGPKSVGDDVDLGEIASPYSLIPPGLYDVAFVKAHPMRLLKGKRLITYWRILDLPGEYHGIVLIMGFSYPKKGKKWGPLSKMAQCYRIAVGRNPDRFDTDRLSTRVFKGKVFQAKVVTVTRSLNQDQRTEENHYSVIDRLIAQKTDES